MPYRLSRLRLCDGMNALMKKGLRPDDGILTLQQTDGMNALMKKGLRLTAYLNTDLNPDGMNALMKKGLRLVNRNGCGLERLGWNECPDEEGIKTPVSAVPNRHQDGMNALMKKGLRLACRPYIPQHQFEME